MRHVWCPHNKLTFKTFAIKNQTSCNMIGVKMPATHFSSFFIFTLCLSLPPSLALIDHWHNSGDVCFIKCPNVFLFLLAKQWIWRKNPAVLLPLEKHYTHLQAWEKLFLLDWSEGKPELFLRAHRNCWSFPCCFSLRVIYQKQAESKAATEAWECICDVLLCAF